MGTRRASAVRRSSAACVSEQSTRELYKRYLIKILSKKESNWQSKGNPECHRSTYEGNHNHLQKITTASLKKKGFRGKIFQAQGRSHANPGGKPQSSACHRTESSSGAIAQRSQAANKKETNLHRYRGLDLTTGSFKESWFF